MASSNRHWPSMFKSKPCNAHHQQWQHHDINSSSSLLSTSCHRTPYGSVPGCEERSPEPKPRWNPKPEQIRILEAIFNSGMVNPPRDEIRKIRAQLQEYGQVGDANVFYWFQNRKSRSKHKLRLLQNSSKQLNSQRSPPQQQTHQTNPAIATSITNLTALSPPSSSSSFSDKLSPKSSKMTLPLSSQNVVDALNSPTGSVNQTSFQQQNEYMVEPFFFPAQPPTIETGGGSGSFTQGFCFSDLSSLVHVQDNNNTVGPCTSLLLSDITSCESSKKDFRHDEKNMKMQSHLSYTVSDAPISHSNTCLAPPLPLAGSDNNTVTIASSVNQDNQGVGESASEAARSTVFINDVAFEVGVGPLNVREAFGGDFVLIHSSGQPVLINDWGVTLHPLQHGASYYLVPFSINEHI